LIPLFLSALQQRVAIFRQNIPLLDHFIHRVAVTLEVFLAVGISLCNASARIAVFLAILWRFGEGDVRSVPEPKPDSDDTRNSTSVGSPLNLFNCAFASSLQWNDGDSRFGRTMYRPR
jgi:hypothetical protein